jgi:hypothetical protein
VGEHLELSPQSKCVNTSFGSGVHHTSPLPPLGEVTRGIDFSPFRLHTKEGVDSQSTMIVDV